MGKERAPRKWEYQQEREVGVQLGNQEGGFALDGGTGEDKLQLINETGDEKGMFFR